MSTRGETMALYRSFLRLRHQFPNKQGRSVLKRWTNNFFSLRQADFHRIEQEEGTDTAEEHAREWRKEAKEELQLWKELAGLDEDVRRRLVDNVIQSQSK